MSAATAVDSNCCGSTLWPGYPLASHPREDLEDAQLPMTQGSVNEDELANLMRGAQNGDARAYNQLLAAITPRLRNFVRSQRRFLRPEDIEDLVQDILLSLHAVRATYDPGRPFIPWVMAIARNRLVDAARRYGRQAAHEVKVDLSSVTFPDDATNNSSEVYSDPDALKEAIRSLPPGQRDAVEMLKLREMSLKEASAATGMSVGALKVSVHRAVGALRKVMRKD